MKKLLSAPLLAIATAGAANAGNYVPPQTEPLTMQAPAVAAGWSGFYLGGMYTFEDESWDRYVNGTNDLSWLINENGFGAFAGYNIQRNNIVFGGELAYTKVARDYMNGVTALAVDDSFLDAKARVGFAANNVLLYGFAGASALLPGSSAGDVTISGYNFGAGAELKFGSGLFVGAEYMNRSLQNDAYVPNIGLVYSTNVVALRAGWQF